MQFAITGHSILKNKQHVMKLRTLQLCSLTAALALAPLTVNAVNATQQPINTRFAQTQDAISIEFSAWSYTDLTLEEADSLDGWSAGFEAVLPVTETMQLRLIVPFQTDAEATITDEALPDVGEKIDIEGDGGLYEFAIIQFEHQLMNYKDHGINAAYTIGAGRKTNELDTTTSDKDLYNHSGKIRVASIKLDRPIFDGKAHWLVNLGVRDYYETDDLHPDDKDDFTWADLKTAVIFAPVCKYFVPVLELTYLGEFGGYDAVALHPEIIIPFNENASIKLGGVVSLSDDGNQGGGAVSLAIGF
jgi:hypothetical protein